MDLAIHRDLVITLIPGMRLLQRAGHKGEGMERWTALILEQPIYL